MYVAPHNAPVPRPVKELKNFARVDLKPGETKSVSLQLDSRAFSYYDVDSHQWVMAPGVYDLLVGSSSADIRLRDSVKW